MVAAGSTRSRSCRTFRTPPDRPVLYLDSSAIVKLVLTEAESDALHVYLAEHSEHVSSKLAQVEVLRALRRAKKPPLALQHAQRILSRMSLVGFGERTLAHAASLEPPNLRSLDAIHLATALSLDGLDAVVTYDRRLADAAADAGLTVASPA